MKSDEAALWEKVVAGERPEPAAAALGMPWKRLLYLLDKWTTQGKWDYGVHPTQGWLNAETPT